VWIESNISRGQEAAFVDCQQVVQLNSEKAENSLHSSDIFLSHLENVLHLPINYTTNGVVEMTQ
jgi:hypothetical protein